MLKGLIDSLEGRFSDVNDGVKNVIEIVDFIFWFVLLEEVIGIKLLNV